MPETEISQTRAALPAHTIEIGAGPLDAPARDSLGGHPYLDPGQEWPVCFCGERLALFFQLDVPEDIAHFGGDHLLVFHCRDHNEATDASYEGGRLVPRYWDAPQDPYPGPFWRVLLQRRADRPTEEREPSVEARRLTLRPYAETPSARGRGEQTFKVGGTPSWAQGPEEHTCACGADLVYLCQVPEDMEFDVRPGLPEQPYSVGADTYNLFLGNEVYLLACPDHCDPAAVWPVNQN